jgi:sialate O-acetylesterase
MNSKMLTAVVLSGMLGFGSPVWADVKPHSLIVDGMVLQQGMKVPLWGTAAEGEEVTVRFQDQSVSAKTKDGKWLVTLDKLQPGGPLEMTITGMNKIHFTNVLVGEVWVLGGASNLSMSVAQCSEAEETIANAKNDKIRLWPGGRWTACAPKTVANFSGVGYLFGRALYKAREVPVGLIQAGGGTQTEAWGYYPNVMESLMPYAIKGIVWSQGTANHPQKYRVQFPAMINKLRAEWHQGDFPFLFVQSGPIGSLSSEPRESERAEKREAQLLTWLQVPNTGMAVTTDVDADQHPKQKKPAGERLALAARAVAYGEKIVYSGPLYDSMKADQGKIILSFKHVAGGLVCKGDKLTGFTIAGPDHKFVNADAQIVDGTVIVSSAKVEKPVAVRFGWADNPGVNLWNKEGLPASPFRTDDFPLSSKPPKH